MTDPVLFYREGKCTRCEKVHLMQLASSRPAICVNNTAQLASFSTLRNRFSEAERTIAVVCHPSSKLIFLITLLIKHIPHFKYLLSIFDTIRPKRDENVEWRRLHNEELHSLYRSPNIVRVIKSRRLRLAGHVARMEEGRSSFKILTGKPTGKRPLRRSRRRWEDNIRMDLEEKGIEE